MSEQNRANAYSRASVKKKMHETIGDDTIVYKIDDDNVFHLPHPFFYDADTKAALKPLKEDDEQGIAKVLLGDQYDRFIDAGGTDGEITLLRVNLQLDTQDSLKNGTPTQR